VSPEEFLAGIIDPGLAMLARYTGAPLISDASKAFLLAIALQESGPALKARYQGFPSTYPGPAKGWWQFEERGGVHGVLHHRASAELAGQVCRYCEVHPHQKAVWRAIEGHDLLACAFARLLVLTDPYPLPVREADAWAQYLRLWRPGKPHPARWPGHWATATGTVYLERSEHAAR